MPGCRISACGPGAQEGTAEPGSPPPPREPLPSPQPPPPTPTLTPAPAPPEAVPESARATEGQELLASALGLSSCVPWGAGRLRRGHGPEPDSPFRRSPPRGPASPQR
ncbi:TMF-regulated nuclear protein 1 [Orycteropus afer afer]|uniref:TMF-regulated nuclear protein 1 n=1 Tax=Orycteropus afer afer TaxID=1230840 RepID=A0A8B6ZEI1_ORYAF|nr:TMF-regulated nuclear protein 1 [Orycteropus afer afer]